MTTIHQLSTDRLLKDEVVIFDNKEEKPHEDSQDISENNEMLPDGSSSPVVYQEQTHLNTNDSNMEKNNVVEVDTLAGDANIPSDYFTDKSTTSYSIPDNENEAICSSDDIIEMKELSRKYNTDCVKVKYSPIPKAEHNDGKIEATSGSEIMVLTDEVTSHIETIVVQEESHQEAAAKMDGILSNIFSRNDITGTD